MLCRCGHYVKRMPGLGTGAGDLVHEERARDTSRLRQIRQRNIIIHHYHLDLAPKGAGPFRRQTEIKSVASVIFNN